MKVKKPALIILGTLAALSTLAGCASAGPYDSAIRRYDAEEQHERQLQLDRDKRDPNAERRY